jgi:Zn-dependent protease
MDVASEERTLSRQTIPLGRILGIPIGLDYSWFLIFALITWTLAVSYYPTEFKNWPVVEYWIIGAVTAVLLFVSVLLHELGHSVIALRYKIPVRSITLFIFGGLAQIGAEPPSATAEFWIAIAGPIVSFTLGGVFGLAGRYVQGAAPVFALAKYLAYINATLGLFNLIPGFPLDGGRVLRAVVWGVTNSLHRATLIAANIGRIIAFGFIILGVWQIFTGNFANGLWIAFIGWFLESAANGQVQQQAAHDLLNGHKVSQAMTQNQVIISPNLTLQQVANTYVLPQGKRFFIVKDGETPIGVLTLQNMKEFPQAEWPVTRVTQAMTSVDKIQRVDPETDLWEALEMMDRTGVNQQSVMTDGRILGVLSREDILGFLQILRKLNYDVWNQ